MSLAEWLGLAALCFMGAASPGPSLAVVLSSSLSGGRSAGVVASWGHAAGVGLYAALTVYGLSLVLTRHPWLFLGMQLAGAAYLLYLALKLWRSHNGPDSKNTPQQRSPSARAALRDGFAVAFLNPKLAIFMLALFSQFIDPASGQGHKLLLIATALGVDGLWYSFITMVVTRPGWVDHLQTNASRIDRSFAVMLALLALTIATRAVLP